MKSMKLGILYKEDKMVNHRSFVKVIMNPMLRLFGFCIATKINKENSSNLGGITLIKCERAKRIKWDFDNHNEFDFIDKRRKII